MTAEREIAGFALPFAAGTAISLVFPHLCFSHPHPALSLSLATLCVCLTILLRSSRKEYPTAFLWTAVIIAAFSCGTLCRIGTEWLSICGQNFGKSLMTYIEPSGSRLKELISSLPFKDGQTNALINSLITGDRSGLDVQTKDIFRTSGASHILALSGMHLGIVYGILKLLLSPIGNSRTAKTARSVIAITVCLFYTLMTGSSPSIVRAFIFILLYETASISGRGGKTGEILMVSLVIQLILCPEDIEDVGFQMSYAAMAGIAFIYPKLNRMWPNDSNGVVLKGLKWVWTSASLAIACQIATGPIAYAYFGTFPEYFLLTNLMAAPLVGLIIPWGLAVIVLSAAGICPQILISGLEFIVQTFTGILENISML